MSTLQDYLNLTRQCLHDANDRLNGSQSDKILWINAARRRVNADCALLRVMQTLSVSSGVETITRGALTGFTITAGGTGYTSVPTVDITGGSGSGAAGTAVVSGGAVTDIILTSAGSGYTSAPHVSLTGGGGAAASASATILHPKTVRAMGVTLIWGSMRVGLTQITQSANQIGPRAWVGKQTRPGWFAQFGQDKWYLSPVPDITYQTEWNTTISPDDLVNTTDVCPLADEARQAVAYYAARMAKLNEQSYSESDEFKVLYLQEAAWIISTLTGSFVANPYR